jgi:hypothetical protein
MKPLEQTVEKTPDEYLQDGIDINETANKKEIMKQRQR